MKLVLTTHNLSLTKAIETHIQEKLDKLDHFDHQAVDARVTLEQDHNRAPERQFSCSVRLSVPGPDLFAEDSEKDLYSAIDLVVKKLEQQIRTRQSKYKARKHTEGAKGKQERLEKDAEAASETPA
jgi:putative sigma-54 modulation protein